MRRLLALLLVQATVAHAYPYLALRPGGSPFEGPADAELSALWWNPAALGQLRGLHFGGVGQLSLEQASIARDAICAETGVPGDCAMTKSFPSASTLGVYGTALGGVSWDFRTENLTIMLGAYAPWESHRRFAGEGAGSTNNPVAYHLRSEDFSTIYFALALAFKISRLLHVGVNVALADSLASLSFDRDAAIDPRRCPRAAVAADGTCTQSTWAGGTATTSKTGYESSQYAERISVKNDRGVAFTTPSGFSITLGGLVRASDRVVIGLSWVHMFTLFSSSGRYGSGSVAGAQVTPPSAAGVTCGGVCRGAGSIDYDIPDVIQGGVRIALSDQLELSTWARVVLYGDVQGRSVSSRGLVVRLSGDPVEKGGAPERILLGRSLTPTFAGEVGLRWRARPSLRLGASLVAETSAVPGGWVNAESFDGPKLDGMLAAEWRVLPFLRLMGGYQITGVVFASLNSPHPGAFNPADHAACVDARFALDACAGTLQGSGLATASGTYSLVTHRFSLGATFDF